VGLTASAATGIIGVHSYGNPVFSRPLILFAPFAENHIELQFATTQILAFIMCLPVMFLTEGAKFSEFVDIFKSSKDLQFNLIMSGLAFYLYNELATYTLKATGPVTASVANTAKRVIVMVYMAAVTGKALTDEQKIGAGVAIVGVLLYSLIDDLLKPKADKKKTA